MPSARERPSRLSSTTHGWDAFISIPFVESQMLACDNCTTRKSAPFQVGANLEPLCNPLQVTFRFLRVLMPASPIASLAGHLPPLRYIGARAGNRGYHVPSPAGPNVPGPVRLAPAYSPMALWRRAPSRRETTGHHLLVRACQQLWLCVLNEDSTTVHLRCACGTSLAPTPRGCWQCRSLPGHPGEPPIGRVRCSRSFEPDRYQSRTLG